MTKQERTNLFRAAVYAAQLIAVAIATLFWLSGGV